MAVPASGDHFEEMGLRARIREMRWVLVAYAVLGLALWPVPLLNILHAESAAVVAFVAFFVAGLSALAFFRKGWAFGRVLATQEAALLVPWALLTLTLVWTPNCGYLQGLLFFLLFPVISVVLAVALAYVLSAAPFRRRWGLFIAIGLAVALLGPLYDLGLHPQLYTYNHVFGGVLGPVYDEELALRRGLFTFRGLTLLWALFLLLFGKWLHERQTASSKQFTIPAVGVSVLIGLCYLFSARLGFNTPAWYIQEALGGHLQTEHFDIYYAPEALSEDELAALADDHEYRYVWLAERLDMKGPERIDSYLYPDPDTKARLTGARYTSVSPVWLSEPQVHLLQEVYARSFGHELVHVFSRAFGLPVLKASAAVGLVEGLAVALEPPSGQPSPDEQVSAEVYQRDPAALRAGLADELVARLSPLGFWTRRGAVSYTTTGSFVRYLHERYGSERLKAVYAWADFEEVYGRPLHALAEEWQRTLLDLPLVARAAGPFVSARFAVPSLFERRCPHYVPPERRAYRKGREALAEGDTTEALGHFDDALEHRPGFVEARVVRARLSLARERPAEVLAALDTVRAERQTPALLVGLGDAEALLGRPDTAQARYEAALRELPLYAQEALAQTVLRKVAAGRPAVIRALAASGDPAVQARRLAGLDTTEAAVRLLLAGRWLEAGAHEPAARLLRRTEAPALRSPFEQEVLQRQRLIWLARAAYRRGDLAEAARHAGVAARAFRAAGGLNEAAYFEDVAAKMEWLEAHRPSSSLAAAGS